MNKKENVIKKKKVTSLDQVLQVKKKKGKNRRWEKISDWRFGKCSVAIRINFYARISEQTSDTFAILCRVEDAALKFRGCFQAICELRSEKQPRGRGSAREGGVHHSRQGVVVLEPIYTSLHRLSLSLSLRAPLIRTRLSPSHPFPTSPHFLSHFHWLVTVRPLLLGHPLFALHTEKRTVTSWCPLDRFTES